MTICERIFKIIDEKHLKTADLARALDIKQSVLSNWKKRNTNPPIEYVLVICEFLDVSVEYLIDGIDENNSTKEEKKLLNAYHSATPAIQTATRKLLDLPEPTKQEPELPTSEPDPEKLSKSRAG